MLLSAHITRLDLVLPLHQDSLQHGTTILHVLFAVLQGQIFVLGGKVLKLVGLALGHADHLVWEADQLSNVDAETLVAHAGCHLVQQRHLPFGIRLRSCCISAADVCRDVKVLHLGVLFGKGCEFVEVGGKHGRAANLLNDVL